MEFIQFKVLKFFLIAHMYTKGYKEKCSYKSIYLHSLTFPLLNCIDIYA